MTTGPSFLAILRVEKSSASEEIKRRFSTTVFLPSTEKVEIEGDAVLADSKRSTRSSTLSAVGGVEGKVCVCETLGGDALKEASLYAKRGKAIALIVTQEPDERVDIPTILISRDQLRSFKDELKGALVSITYTSGSYETHPVTFVLQSFGVEEDALEWDGKIHVSANTTDHLDIEREFVSEAIIFSDHRGDIVEFLNKDSMVGRVCLVGECNSDRHFTQILRLAAQYGAAALFTTYENPPRRNIPLPVVVVEKKHSHRMKLGAMVTFNYKSDSQRKASKLEPQATLAAPKSYASALQDGSKSPSKHTPRRHAKPAKKNNWGWGILGDAVTTVGRSVGLMKYSPESKERFEAIVANGTDWLKDVPLYFQAIELLKWVDSVEDSQDRLTELAALNEAIDGMINENSVVGDILMVHFCAELRHMLTREASRQLMENAVKLIKNIKIDESDPISSSLDLDTTDLNQYIIDLVTYLSNQPSNKGSMKGFVLNALWIRVHHCQSVKDGRWDNLKAIATRTLFKDEQETLLSFMSLPQFSTLAVCTATSFQDICAFFSGEDKIIVLKAAIDGLLRLYQSDSTNRSDWQKEFGSIREVTAFTILDRFETETIGFDILEAETIFIDAIIQNIERKPTLAFGDFGCVYDCLRVDSKLNDLVTELMMKSICSSLQDKRGVPSPTSVSGLLQMDIGRHLLSERRGFIALKSYIEDRLIKVYSKQDREKLVLLGRISRSFFACGSCSGEEAVTVMLNAIRKFVNTSQDYYKLCLTAIDVSQNMQDIFYDEDNSNLPSKIGEIFIRETGICSTIRSSPSQLRNVTNRLRSRPQGRLSHFMYQELVRGLKGECKNIDSAISFHESAWKGDFGQSPDSRNIVYEIIINSFSNWDPSSITDLLKVEAPLLRTIHGVLVSISTEENCEEIHQKASSVCLDSIRSIAGKWREKFEKEKCNVTELQTARNNLTDAKQEVLSNILASQFPSPSDIDEKIAEMENLIEIIRSSLHFSVTKDDDIFTLSIRDLATHYRIKIESPLSHVISKYLTRADPNVDLCSIRRDSKYTINFVSAHKTELQAASHFRFCRSALFQNEVGVWTEIYFDDFFAKVSASLLHLKFLLSPAATFSSVSAAANVLDGDNVGFDVEMTAIMSLHVVDDEQTRVRLKDVMTLAKLAKQLSNFVESCKTFKFAFAECDDCFGELQAICNQMDSDEGAGWDIRTCVLAGERIVEILMPEPSVSGDLSERLQYYLPLIDFFDALRHCSSVLDLAREKSWFGRKGLSTFYQEFENVTNVLNQKQSYEMEVLNRLEPTMQCISAVGGNLQCDSVATLLEILNANNYFSHQNITAMRIIQENIVKIQDWLSEGMDDMAGILSKFALIQSSGRIVISSEDSMDEATTSKRELSLYFSRSDASNEVMNESEVRELVQYLGFTTHESDESRMHVERFVRVYEQCGNVMACQQAMADVGFGSDDATKRLEFILSENSEDLAQEWLDEADTMIEECKGWLGQVRSSNRQSLLFWKDELRFIFLCMCDIRSGGGDKDSVEWQLIMSILSRMPLHPDCSNLLAQFASEAPSGGSWLEDVSIFVSECGIEDHITSSLGSSNVIIHKVDCLDNTIFAAQLQLMHHIYKNRCPASFEYLDASCIKSSEHVAIFLERVRAFPEHIFLIAYVERLPASEQELIATFIAQHARSADTMHLHCIQSKDTVLYASPGVSISSWNDSSLNEYYPSQWLQGCVASNGHVSNITIVFSDSPGSGKTKFIRSQLERANANGTQVASIYIHEDFTLTKAVEQLRNKFGEGGSEDKSIHFGLSCDAEPSDEVLLSVNHFFNSFLLFGHVYDPTSGDSFYGSSHKWNVFVEMSVYTGDEDAAQVWLREHVPILSYCSLHILQPPSDFIIDEKARRVATYLRAYDNGTIDRKFNSTPTNKTILFVLDKSGSMCATVGGRSRFQVASESMLSVFNSHIRVMDSVGLVLFDHCVEEVVPFQRIESDQDLISVRRVIANLTIGPDGGTAMYTALQRVLQSVNNSALGRDEDVWIVCLTDGQSADTPQLVSQQLRNTPDNLHVILIGVGLEDSYHQAMRDLCNKYHAVNQPNNKGIFLPTALDINDIEVAFNEVASRIPVSQTFELDGAMSDEQCRDWLDRYRPHFISPANKLVYSFWVSFIYRRIRVFDASEDFNYNETYDSLGSSLMKVMLDESEQMLMRDQTDTSWSVSNHTQLIYDFSQPESPKFRLICTSPDDLDPVQKEKFEQLDLPGFALPNMIELRRRETLDRYLSQALSIPLTEDENGNQFLQCVNDHRFVLTLDFTLKLLNIHEHVSCGAPCVMEGETGVSKTALTKMYSILVNSQQMRIASVSTVDTLELTLHELMTAFPGVALDNDGCILEQILTFLEISSQHTSTDVGRAVEIIDDKISLALLRRSALFLDKPSLAVSNDGGIDGLAPAKEMLKWFSESHLEQLFFDINIHASLTADDINEQLIEAKRVARKVAGLEIKVVVFLDEINTASVLGLIKEIIVDRSLNGDPLEENIVIVAACNPVRKSTLSQVTANRVTDLGREWVSGHYQVRQLPPSLSTICWDFGALKREQEKEFIQQRIIMMMDESLPHSLTSRMTEIISSSHEFIRELARDHIMKSSSSASMQESEAFLRARSVVSLRDIQRVFHLTDYFLNQFTLKESNSDMSTHPFRRAMLVSVAIVYYLRLDSAARNIFVKKLSSLPTEMDEECGLLDALGSAMNTVVEATEIPEGISLTSGLKENIFVTLVCTLARVPLMIIGPPGCSKTLAVSIVNDNANGEESPSQYYRDLARIQPFHYQCSKASTSNEVAAVFSRAEQRQMTVDRARQQCLVFMDEAGLPEEERESLKVLHYLLEGHMSSSPNVAFVCITNHTLDAAKSNRCVGLHRPEPDMEELSCILEGVLGQKLQHDYNGVELVCFEQQVVEMKEFSERMCSCYMDLMKNTDRFSFFVDFFGLRDFIHFLKFLRRSAPPVEDSILHITEEVFVNALERNFNGIDKEQFANICAYFMAKGLSSCDQIKPVLEKHIRDPMEVIHNALSEQPTNDVSRYNLPRYKMIIDHTNDDSVTRLLQISGVLNSSHAFYKLSGIDEGAEIEKLNLVSKVKFAAQYGKKTVVLSQVEGVSECFYDLFNQHFKEFRKEDGEVSYFANIAIGGVSRPCLISPSFQCIVHVQSSQLANLPAPFLNRFEKFQLNIDDILRWRLKQLTPGLCDILNQSLQHSQDFVESIGANSVWSPSAEDTLKSIYISLIRPELRSENHSLLETGTSGDSIASDVLEFILNNFDVDMTVEDIQSCIDSARVEYRSSKDGVELERVIDCVSKGKIVLPFEDVRNDCLRTPLSRALKQIILSSITRCVVVRLLQLVRPDALYLRRHAVPGEVLRLYFGEQEHFSLKRLIRKLSESNNTTSQFHIVYARSDSCAHSLPTWSNNDGIDPSILHRVRSLVHDDPSAVEIHHLDLLKSESEIRTTFDGWVSKELVKTFILVVDMKMQSTNIVNFIRSYVEQATLSSDKQFILLLHFPLSCDQSIYPALFLGKWCCIFLDGIGDADGNSVDFNNVLQSACSLTGQKLNADTLLGALKPKALQYVASQVPFYSCSNQPHSINHSMTLTERMDCIEKILSNEVEQATLETILCRKFILMWTDERIREVVYRSAYALASGKSKLSFSSALTSTLQSSFNKFLAKSVLEMNIWANLDVLDRSSADAETERIFALALNRLPLPGVPLQELLLIRDVNHQLIPLPMEVKSREAIVVFPFFFQISSLIEMAIDKANFDFLDQSSLDQNDDFGPLFLERVDALLGEMAESMEAMAGVVRDIVTHVADSESLFSRYLQHVLAWSYGCKNLVQVEKWIALKMDTASMMDSSLHCNILYLHIICRKNVGSILRIASWDSEEIAKELLQNEVQFEGISFVSAIVSHFLRLVGENFEANKWSNSFSLFLNSFAALMEGGVIEDEALIVNLRLLILLNVLISVDVEERAVGRIIQTITEDTTSTDIATVSGCLGLLKDSMAMGETPTKTKEAQDHLLRIFFSPWWLKVVSNKVYNDDAIFLMSAIKQRRDYIKEQTAVVLLRNVLTCRRGNGSQSALPTSSFLPSIVVLLSCELNAAHHESFSESGDRVGMPHFVPHWLSTEGVNTPSLTDGSIDEVDWYLRNYHNSFDDCPLAKVVSDIIFGELIEKATSINSDELLIMFQASIQEQKEVNQATNARLLRCSGQASLQGPVSIKGCYVRALETDAILLTFVCKVAEELSNYSRSFALEGVNAACAVRILNGVMPIFRWPDFFFKVIMKLKGSGHLANLLSEGGPLHNFNWCQQWMQGLSSHQRDVEMRLRRSEAALREAEIDEDNKARQFRRCPHCNEMFGVDQVNCGVFYCGRDAHGANGPAVGGIAVQGGYGCGGQFRLDEAIPYARDETLLGPLREEVLANRNLFEASNQGAEIWARAERLDIPPISFHLQNEDGTSISKIFNSSLVDHLRQTPEEENICRLAAILNQLPRLEHVSCLPDLIEFYIFIHKTFRHVVTREESFNMKLRDVMDERLLRARFGAVHASHLYSLFLRVVEKVNLFLTANENRVNFECEDVAMPFTDLMDVSLIQVLSEAEHPSNGHDTLFLVISDLLMRYNNFIISISTFKEARSVDDKPEEIHPRSLVRGSKNSIAVSVSTEDVASTLANLIESYWEDGSFALEGLLEAIQREFDVIGSLQTVMPPLSFLRERFVFRDCFVGHDEVEESDQCFFSPHKQFYFAQREDWMLYEDVRDKAMKKCSGDKDGICSIRHKMIVTFQSLGHGEWTSLLEGMRNTLDGLDFSNAQEFGEATALQLGIDSLQAVGFPAMDGAGSTLIHTLSKDDIVEFIDVSGEQLSSEVYQFNRLPSRLSEPILADVRESLESNIHLLLQTKSSSDIHNEIQAFCEDVLSFYEPHIVTVSEQSNEPLESYLRRNNAWDNADSICAALPSNLGIRNYIDIRKVFHQLKLRLRQTGHDEIKSDSEVPPDLDTPDSNAWKWVARPSRNNGAEEEISNGIFDRLWFEEAIRPREVDTSNMIEEEADQTVPGDNEDAVTLDDGNVEDSGDNEDAVTLDDGSVEVMDEVVPDLDDHEEEEHEELQPVEEIKEAEEVANEVADDSDSDEANNIEEDESATTAALSAHYLAAANQTGSTGVQEAGEVPVKAKERQGKIIAIAAVAFVMIFAALVYVYRSSALATDYGAAEAESNEIEECKEDDVMAELTAESNEFVG